jgi:hypothetical protein
MFEEMKAVRQLGALVLLLLWSIAPTMACTLPMAQMTAQERACCGEMKSQCGQTDKAASQCCCQKLPQSIVYDASRTKAVALNPLAGPAILLPIQTVLSHDLAVVLWFESLNSSPPKFPPSSISVLRI